VTTRGIGLGAPPSRTGALPEPKVHRLQNNLFLSIIQESGLPSPELELRFHPQRKWRFDYAWPEKKVAMEVEGVLYRVRIGRHQRGLGYEADCEKYAEALVLGWKVLRVTPGQIRDGRVIIWLKQLLMNG